MSKPATLMTTETSVTKKTSVVFRVQSKRLHLTLTAANQSITTLQTHVIRTQHAPKESLRPTMRIVICNLTKSPPHQNPLLCQSRRKRPILCHHGRPNSQRQNFSLKKRSKRFLLWKEPPLLKKSVRRHRHWWIHLCSNNKTVSKKSILMQLQSTMSFSKTSVYHNRSYWKKSASCAYRCKSNRTLIKIKLLSWKKNYIKHVTYSQSWKRN